MAADTTLFIPLELFFELLFFKFLPESFKAKLLIFRSKGEVEAAFGEFDNFAIRQSEHVLGSEVF